VQNFWVGSFAYLAISSEERRNLSDVLVDSAGIVAGGATGAMAHDGVAGAMAHDGAAGAMAADWAAGAMVDDGAAGATADDGAEGAMVDDEGVPAMTDNGSKPGIACNGVLLVLLNGRAFSVFFGDTVSSRQTNCILAIPFSIGEDLVDNGCD
jgi:hypothetical protein